MRRACVMLAAIAAVALSAPSVTFSPDTLPSSGSVVTIKWTGVDSPSSQDLLVVQANLNNGAGAALKPLGFMPVNATAGWETGSGVFSFPLVNMRTVAYSFAYVRVRLFADISLCLPPCLPLLCV